MACSSRPTPISSYLPSVWERQEACMIVCTPSMHSNYINYTIHNIICRSQIPNCLAGYYWAHPETPRSIVTLLKEDAYYVDRHWCASYMLASKYPASIEPTALLILRQEKIFGGRPHSRLIIWGKRELEGRTKNFLLGSEIWEVLIGNSCDCKVVPWTLLHIMWTKSCLGSGVLGPQALLA